MPENRIKLRTRPEAVGQNKTIGHIEIMFEESYTLISLFAVQNKENVRLD